MFNLQLGRSKVRARLDRNDDETAVLKSKVAELERWRAELEARLNVRNSQVDTNFDNVRNRINDFQETQRQLWL